MPDADGRTTLESHLRDAHPNLLHEACRLLRYDEAATSLLRAVHDANHAVLYRNHAYDDWLARKARTGPTYCEETFDD